MSDNIVDFATKAVETVAKEEGPAIRTFRLTYIDGYEEDATGVLITTSSFVAVGTYTPDGAGVNFEAFAPMSQVKRVKRIA